MAISVGLRQLRGDLSSYIKRAAAGERVVITDHNRPIVELVAAGSIKAEESDLEWLVREHGAILPQGDIKDFKPSTPLTSGNFDAILVNLIKEREESL